MPSQTSVLLDAIGPQAGYGMPFGGIYSNVYGTTPQSQMAQSQYWDTMMRGYDNQQQQLMRDAFSGGSFLGGDLSTAVSFDPQTGQYAFDPSKVDPNIRKIQGYGPEADARLRAEYEKRLNSSNEDQVQARQQLELVAQKRLAQQARVAQQGAENAGFQQELQRYNAPNLLGSMITPQIQNAGNQVMANANAAGMAGGSMGQAANRRAAMMGFGQGAAAAVPQAAVQQADLNFQYQKAREGMINNYYNMQQQRAQTDLQNQMALTGFQKSMEEYEHNRSLEGLKMGASFLQNAGAWGARAAGAFGGGGGGGGGGGEGG